MTVETNGLLSRVKELKVHTFVTGTNIGCLLNNLLCKRAMTFSSLYLEKETSYKNGP
jgi:hypothetical protein